MTPVHQKPKHCLVACLLSAQEDQRLRNAQGQMVQQYAALCHAGTADAGVVDYPVAFNQLTQALGLTNQITWVHDPGSVVEQLKMNRGRNITDEMCYFLITTHPTNHAARVSRILNRGIEVMDPATGRFEIWAWKKLKHRKCRMAFFAFT